MPLYVSVAPEAVSKVPPEAPRLIPRLALSVNVPVVASVPPLIVREPGVTNAGDEPRLLSAEILIVPAPIVVAPV